MEEKIFYICDKKKCEVCYPECKHTSDITHAANFKPAPILVDGQARLSDAYFEKTLHEFNDNLTCNTCKYEPLDPSDQPCDDCTNDYCNWEKKDD